MLTNLSIVQRILGLFSINIIILLAITTYSYFFTNNSMTDLKHIEKKSFPVSVIQTENLFLLEKVMNSFADIAVTNEEDILDGIAEDASRLLDNFNLLEQHGVDTQEQLILFNKYFEYAYQFTNSVIKDKNNFNMEDAILLRSYSSKILIYFKEQKSLSKDNLYSSLTKLSNDSDLFFKYSLFVSSVGLFIVFIFGAYTYRRTKHRFRDIISSVRNLTKKEPDFSIRIESIHNDEIGQLIKMFNRLSNKLESAHEKSSEEFLKEIEDTQKEVVFTMGAIAEKRSEETGNHVKRVAEYSKLLAIYYGLDEYEADLLKQASPMHDIGKVAIPDNVLNKPGSFTDEERKIMDKHVLLGYDMLKHSDRPILKTAAIVALEHHEKYDGSGYPYAKKGEDIHIYGRITALADVFDALGSDRVYKKAWDDERIFSFFKEERAKHFDPKLIDIFFDKLDEFLEIRDTFKD